MQTGKGTMEELQIQISNTLGEITTNFEEIETNLKAIAADYKGIIVTEDTLKQCKKDVSELRKIIKDIEDSRKAIKKQWNVPYIQFEEKCKQLESVIEEPIEEINNQVAVFEQKRIEEKQSHLHDLYNECIGEYSDYLTFEAVKKPQWDNATYSDKDVKFDVSEAVTKVRSEIDAIKALHSEIEDECLRVYKNSSNSLTAAIQKNSDYISAKEMARKKFEEEKLLEAEKKAEEEFMNPPIAPTACQPAESVDVWKEPTFTFRVTGEDHIKRIKEMLEFSEIPYIEV